MRRKDREVKDPADIFDILNRCDTIRIAMQGETCPYAVPVSFGAEVNDGKTVIYFHCAREGMKTVLLKANPHVCAEGDIFLGTELTDRGITARYESVIGFGECRFVEDPDEILHGLKHLTAHYGYEDYDVAHCGALQRLCVGKIVLNQITGKRNLAPRADGIAAGRNPDASAEPESDQ